MRCCVSFSVLTVASAAGTYNTEWPKVYTAFPRLPPQPALPFFRWESDEDKGMHRGVRVCFCARCVACDGPGRAAGGGGGMGDGARALA
eukprot:23571-Rhodomonas_salina.4